MVTRNPLELPSSGRMIGLDYGKARIGLAVSDSARRLATARGAAEGDFATQMKIIGATAREIGAVAAVVGLPLNMDGTHGPSATAAMSFASEVEKRLGLPVLVWDERLSSRQAEAAFFEQREGRQTRGNKKQSVGKMDAGAAAVVLQSVLNAWQSARDVAGFVLDSLENEAEVD